MGPQPIFVGQYVHLAHEYRLVEPFVQNVSGTNFLAFLGFHGFEGSRINASKVTQDLADSDTLLIAGDAPAFIVAVTKQTAGSTTLKSTALWRRCRHSTA